MKNRRLFTCGFLFALFAVVEGSGLNVVDGRVSWRMGHADTLTRPKMIRFPPSLGDQLGLKLQREGDGAVVAAEDIAADTGVAHGIGD